MGLFIALLASCVEGPADGILDRFSGPPPLNNADPVTDTFVVGAPERVDLLFVLDSSGPLEDPTPLVEHAPAWLDTLVSQDFHLGVVTADLHDPNHQGKLIAARGSKWIDGSTPDPLAVFAELVDVGTGGSSAAQSLGAAYTALEVHADTFNAGFLRDDSAVHVVVVSMGEDETDPAFLTRTEFVDWLDALRPETRSLSCLRVGPPLSSWCAEVATALDGIDGELSDPVAHDQLGAIVSSGHATEFNLSRRPVDQTIQVRAELGGGSLLFDGAVGGFWVYDAVKNSVLFPEYVPSDGTVVTIEYAAAY